MYFFAVMFFTMQAQLLGVNSTDDKDDNYKGLEQPWLR